MASRALPNSLRFYLFIPPVMMLHCFIYPFMLCRARRGGSGSRPTLAGRASRERSLDDAGPEQAPQRRVGSRGVGVEDSPDPAAAPAACRWGVVAKPRPRTGCATAFGVGRLSRWSGGSASIRS
jgi:hypothetical protein